VAATAVRPKLKIRKGDTVEVLTGKDLGRRGKVLEVIPSRGRLVVEHINIAKRHSKPRPVKGTRGAQMTGGGVLDLEAPLPISNVALVCPSCDQPTRVGYTIRPNGDKVRHCRRPGCGKDIEK
jgi:large subunit ribosomal protein L24